MSSARTMNWMFDMVVRSFQKIGALFLYTAANLVNGIIGCVLSLAVAAVATYFIGFSKDDLKA